ncbi:CLUMA_CG018338, isoform A [Clunio marinus]|uniref:CLUMA_CG018338, isoform A n=1 Tax=Clunio marinus TaxID=568069 RepID=A0A1J1IYR7_9DIPT|nr:CLUMA_CG018338, isoform A [Clunio marinus]
MRMKYETSGAEQHTLSLWFFGEGKHSETLPSHIYVDMSRFHYLIERILRLSPKHLLSHQSSDCLRLSFLIGLISRPMNCASINSTLITIDFKEQLNQCSLIHWLKVVVSGCHSLQM